MDTARWQALKDAFTSAIEAEPEAQRALLERLRASDPELCAEVESLLAADGGELIPLETPAADLLARAEAELATADAEHWRGPEPGMTLREGTRVGPYVVGPLLDTGGMGCVYRARDTRLDRDVALKVLRHETSDFARFQREAKAVAALSHPNIVAIHDYGEDDGRPYMVSELLIGRTLREALQSGPLPVRRVVEYALQIAAGLAAAHDKGIIHRDLKPENVFITRDERVKLLDFGIARATHHGDREARASLTSPGTVIGTLGYMSPEQVLGETVTPASDVFALGAILYEMLTGARAFGGDSGPAKMRAVLSEDPPPLQLEGALPAGLGSLVARCLEKRPEARFQSARDVAFAIAALAEGQSASAPRITPRPAWSWRGLVLSLAGMGALVAAAWVGRITGTEPSTGARRQSIVTLRTLTHSGRDLSPAASPDGRLIAFRSDRDGTGRIWLRQTASGEERALTSGPDDYPRFSPDGAWLLFTRIVGGRSALFRVPVLGGEPRRIVDDASDGDIAPEGRRLAFIRWGREQPQARPRLFVAGVDGSNERLLATLDNRVRACPRFSPDGDRLAVTGLAQQPGAPATISIVPTGGGEIERIAAPSAIGYVSCVAWTASARIAYAQAESVMGNSAGSPARVFEHDLAARSVRPLFASPSTSLTLDLLGDRTLIFDARSAQQNLHEAPLRSGGPARWLTHGLGTNRQPVFTPRGDFVVFSSNQSGNLDLWAISTTTGAIRRLTDHPAEDWDPAFAPDGQLLWSSNRSGHFEIWRAAEDGSGARQVTRDGVDAENPSATRDGWIVYASGHPAHRGIWKVRLDGSAAAKLLDGAILPEASPDGAHFVYQSNRNPRLVEIGVARLADGVKVFETTLRVQRPTPAILGRARWVDGGRRLAFVGQNERGQNGVFVQDFTPKEDTRATRRPLAGFAEDDVTESFAVAPDGARIVLARWAQSLSLMTATGVSGLARPAPATSAP